MAGWDFQARAGSLASMYDKDERWLLSSMQSQKSLADSGHLRTASLKLMPMTSSTSLASSASLPSLRIKPLERNPISGAMPYDTPHLHDWTSHSNTIHRGTQPSQSTGTASGGKTRFGLKDPCTGKISYLPAGEQFGVPEAFGVQRAEAAFGVSRLDHRRRPITADPGFTDSQPHLSRATLTRTPSMVELDDLLRRRSRARGLGGKHARVVDAVQTRWNVLYASGSAASCTMKVTGSD